jgi:hypothetical protein
MNTSNNVPTEAITYQDQFQFVGKRELSKLTGLSGDTLKKYRLQGMLSENIHWIRINPKVVRYNVPLIKDWLQNINNPQAHQQAIEAYLATLLSSSKRSKRRRGCSQVSKS